MGPVMWSHPTVKIVSWMGGEHRYIGSLNYLQLEDATRSCERNGLYYEIVEDPNHFYGREGD